VEQVSEGFELREAVDNREILLTVRSRRSHGEVNPGATAYRHSRFKEVRRRLIEIAILDFPSYSEPLISIGQVVRDPSISGFDVRGFRPQGNFTSWIRDPRNPEVTWSHGTPGKRVESRWR
jgi:hypothetical protein